jgi:agmatine/peptidylarginine deiminase
MWTGRTTRLFIYLHLPLTSRKLRRLRDWGTYTNFDVANEVILVPKCEDKNDRAAQEIIKRLYLLSVLYPERELWEWTFLSWRWRLMEE